MKSFKNIKLCLLILSALFLSSCSNLNDQSSEINMLKNILDYDGEISEVKLEEMDDFVKENLSGVTKAFIIDGKIAGVVSETVGYSGVIKVLTVFDNENNQVKSIEILDNQDSLDYAGLVGEDWFTSRFTEIDLEGFFNLVPLDKVNGSDIVQVTGATISSQAVVNGVNSAVGLWNYMNNSVEMEAVPRVVFQEMWNMDDNSFLLSWPFGEKRITVDELKNDYPVNTVNAQLNKTTGTKIDIEAEGVYLTDILEKEGIDLNSYPAIGISGRDGYYTMIDSDKLSGPILLAYKVDGKDLIRDERPVRLILPDEMGPYWVKMISSIELYYEVAEKDIDSLYIFDTLVKDIEPYYYEYYGSKDKAYEVGRILDKFDGVDLKGFFTMTSSDGLVKNETISMVRDRYYIKVEGDNAPMNIAPTFKLGMNVKFMSHFSTTKDAVIFPEQMKNISRTEIIDGREYMKLEDVMINAGLNPLDESWDFYAFDTNWEAAEITMNDIADLHLSDGDKNYPLHKISQDELGEYWLSAEPSGNALLKGSEIVMENFAGIKRYGKVTFSE